MAPFGYHPVKHTSGLWFHNNKKTLFSLVVDDFCVQYSSTEDADHFLYALRAKYLITVDMEAAVYIGIKLTWGYVHRTVTFPCPVMYKNYYTYSSTSSEEAKSNLLIHVLPSSMDIRSNMQTLFPTGLHIVSSVHTGWEHMYEEITICLL